jgi:xanthine dehydrogenase iron-sulfur cluster and FAD-binding subunit A
VEVVRPDSWAEALDAAAALPDAVRLAGGTDLMVELNFDRRRPAALIDLGRVAELREWSERDGRVRLGAGVPYTRVIAELGERLPGLALAARTVGSPQIRNRGTVGGNLGSASPAGDAHPPLLACGAVVELESRARGVRRVPADAFYLAPKRSAALPDELIRAVEIPCARGPQQFAKIGTRNAMVIAACSFALALDPVARTVGTGIGSAGPTPLRASDAEGFLAELLDERGGWESGEPLGADAAERFGALVAAPDRRRARNRRLPPPRARCARAAHARVGTCRAEACAMKLALTVNGEPREADLVWEGESLLYVLRERLGLPGSKNACEQGECGSCSVVLDGTLACSCLVLARQAEGAEVTTVEGLGTADALGVVQEAFVAAGAVQCGFCTPGLVVAVHDLLARDARPSEPEVREQLAGNLCRCTGYAKILDAVQLAAERLIAGGGGARVARRTHGAAARPDAAGDHRTHGDAAA